MADVFTTSKFEVKHDKDLNAYTMIVSLPATVPAPKGPFIFGVTKEQLQELLKQISAALKA